MQLGAWARAMLLESGTGRLPTGHALAVVDDRETPIAILTDSCGPATSVHGSNDGPPHDQRARINVKRPSQMIQYPHECLQWISVYAQVARP